MTFISKSTHWTSSSSCVQQCAAAPPPPAPPLPRGALTWPTPTHRVAQLTQTSVPLNELIIRIEHFNLMCLIFFKKTVTENLTFVYGDSLMQRFPAVYVTILEIKISICMSVCLYVCLYVCMSVGCSLIARNYWTDFQNSNANNSSLMQNRVLCLSFLESTSGFARKIENDLEKQVFGS